MFQIDNSTAVAAIPDPTPAGSAGYFTDGNPATGVSATILPAEFMNMLMMENLNVLSAGGIDPVKGRYNQLAMAINKIVQAAAQSGNTTYALDVGATNAYAATYTPAITSLTDGMVLRFKAKNSNTAASTFSPNGLPAKPIVGLSLGALAASSILANGHCAVCYSQVIDSWILTYSLGAGINWSAISGTPTTRDGYGLTDVYTITQTNNLLATKSNVIDVTAALAGKANIATTLAGYNIPVAATSDATTGTNDTLPMTPLKVFQAIAQKVPVATNTVVGVSRFATQPETNSGSLGTVAISPLTLIARMDAGGFGANSNIKISTTGTNQIVAMSASSVFVNDGTGRGIYASFNISIAFSNSGANGLDTGSAAANTWYYVWVISNGSTTTGILSLSSTSPTMPGGFTLSARIGAVRTGPTAGVPLSTIQVGSTVSYKVAAGSNTTVLPLLINGIQGNPATATPTFTAASISSVVPPTAVRVGLSLAGYCGNNSAIAAPNNAYAGIIANGTAQSCPLQISAATNAQMSVTGYFVIESTSVYYASSASPSGLSCIGWEDSI